MRRFGRCLTIESLESRHLMAAFNMPWPEIGHMTLSFVPDGTQVGERTSGLYAMMEGILPESNWQSEALKAFQAWAVEANGAVELTHDQGLPIGTVGFKQGDLRFGDVRIGAFPMDGDVLAVANPYDPFIVNTWVGDVFLNSAHPIWQSTESKIDTFRAIMLHEAGHVFGLGHSSDPFSPMYPHFNQPNKQLTPADIAALRAIYNLHNTAQSEVVIDNDNPGSVEELTTTPGYVEYTYYETEGLLTTSTPSKTYRVRSANVDDRLANIFTIIVGTTDSPISQLKITVRGPDGNEVPFQTIARDDNTVALQMEDSISLVDYLITVEPIELENLPVQYEIEVDFAHDSGQSQIIVNEQLSDSQPIFHTDFTVDQSELFHFTISASDWNASSSSGLQMMLLDSTGRMQATIEIEDGATRVLDLFLDPGEYTWWFDSPNRAAGVKVIFELSSQVASSPIGPLLRDTLNVPVHSNAAVPLVVLQVWETRNSSIHELASDHDHHRAAGYTIRETGVHAAASRLNVSIDFVASPRSASVIARRDDSEPWLESAPRKPVRRSEVNSISRFAPYVKIPIQSSHGPSLAEKESDQEPKSFESTETNSLLAGTGLLDNSGRSLEVESAVRLSQKVALGSVGGSPLVAHEANEASSSGFTRSIRFYDSLLVTILVSLAGGMYVNRKYETRRQARRE